MQNRDKRIVALSHEIAHSCTIPPTAQTRWMLTTRRVPSTADYLILLIQS